ncbi:(R)-stereoselective amidase [Peptococcaceae bacterium CEB3]|nr:(R)-stereoselective amidase [Peptococcaceae bacterium CEB3]
MQDLEIALVQFRAEAEQTQKNLERILRLAEEGAGHGAKMICYPEMALQGYAPETAQMYAERIEGDKARMISEQAAKLEVALLVGMAEKAEGLQKPYLSQLIAFPDGRVEVYRKTHLGRQERRYFTPGNELPVFEGVGVRFAVGICWDWHFPEVAAIYSLKGAEVLFAPHASPVVSGDRKSIWLRYLGARAYDNSVYLAACNLRGDDGRGRRFSGGALVLGPKGDVCAEDSGNEMGSEIVYAHLGGGRLNALRKHSRTSMKESFFLADRRKELYRELIELEVPDD